MPFKPKIRFVANTTMVETRRQFGLFAFRATPAAKEGFEGHFKGLRNEMRQRSTTVPLYKWKGRLGGSFDREVSGNSLSQLKASVFSHSSYSVIHEAGGTVLPPKGKQWIFIPTEYNIEGRVGSRIRRARKTPQQVQSEGGYFIGRKQFRQRFPEDAEDTLRIMQFVSRMLLITPLGIPMFTMVKRATYKAQLGFFEVGARYEQRILVSLGEKFTGLWSSF